MDIIKEIKFFISILGFVFIVYPFRKIIIPLYFYLMKDMYMILCLITLYTGLYLYDFNLKKLIGDLVNKLVTEDMWFIELLVTPINFFGFEISLLYFISIICLLLVAIKVLLELKIFYNKIKEIFGDILVVCLWIFYKFTGNTENSVMLISKDEAKTKIYMYLILIFILSIFIILAYLQYYSNEIIIMYFNQTLTGESL